MSDFITRLAQRQLGQLPMVKPRLPSRFASTAAAPMPSVEESAPTDTLSSRFADPRSAPADIPHRGVAAEIQANLPHTPDKASEPPVRNLFEADRHVQNPAREAAISTPQPMARRHNSASIPAATEPVAEESVVVSARSSTKGVTPVATQLGAVAPPLQGREAARPENPFEGAAPPRLVETRAPSPMAALPRLEVRMSNRGEAAVQARATAEPPIQVTIGRIEVTALTQAAPAKRPAAPRPPAMSLNDYLARRQRGER